MRLLSFITLAAYTLLVADISLTPGGGGGLPLWDKSMHFTVYAIFALLASASVKTKLRFWQLLLAIAAYSALLEVGQHFVEGRYMSAPDLVANCLGIGFGACLSLWVQPHLRGAQR